MGGQTWVGRVGQPPQCGRLSAETSRRGLRVPDDKTTTVGTNSVEYKLLGGRPIILLQISGEAANNVPCGVIAINDTDWLKLKTVLNQKIADPYPRFLSTSIKKILGGLVGGKGLHTTNHCPCQPGLMFGSFPKFALGSHVLPPPSGHPRYRGKKIPTCVSQLDSRSRAGNWRGGLPGGAVFFGSKDTL